MPQQVEAVDDADHAAAGTSGAAAPDHGSESDPPESDVESGPVEEPAVAIPMVREQLRRVAGGDLFSPQTVAIGPYHQRAGGPSCPFPWTEGEKRKAVRHVATLIGEADVARLKLLVAQMEPLVRECYTHPLHHTMDSPQVLSRMLLHDGCYVLTFFLDFALPPHSSNASTTTNAIAARDSTLVRDILYLVENQIPLFLLTRMLDHIRGSVAVLPGQNSAVECIAGPVRQLLHKQLYISQQQHNSSTSSTCSDLLHLVHSYFRRRGPPPQEEDDTAPVFGPDEQWTILDIGHDGGTLYIPFLRVGASTLTMLRNLMALEERLEDRPVTAYCVFLSQLACTAEDVDLLQRSEVLEHFLGSDDEAAGGLADLCNGVVLDIDNVRRNYLKPTWHHLDRRCRMPLHNFKGLFRDKYCRSVFYRLVFFVALVLFLCQVTQVTYAVLAYHRPPKQ
ncbi:hypothetical protein U9M48_000469 [Paspalum notatum var. saurae]|uniref:Uncharacterized protein n=1 Tax=Paspalum notatum var. saurae TaxID=547442 RepID=A0AAQ3SCE1_PASNO